MRALIPAFLFALSASAQLTVIQSCEGVTARYTGTTPEYKDHPDAAGDVGPSHVVEISGQDFAVYDRVCSQLQRITTKQFFTNAGGGTIGAIYDPRIVYDAAIGRWVAVGTDTISGNNYVAVSAGTNPLSSNTSAWKLTTTPPSGAHDDFLQPAWDVNGLYVSQYGGNILNDVSVFSPKDLQWSGSGKIGGPSGGFFRNIEYLIIPTTDPDPNKGATDPELMVFRDFGNGSAAGGVNVPFNLVLRQIFWSGGAATTNVAAAPSGYLFNTPVPIAQPGGTLRPAEDHLGAAYEYNRAVYVVLASGPCSTNCRNQPVTTHNGFFWFKVDPVALTILDKGLVFDSKMDHSFPGIVVDGNGNMVIVDTCSDGSTTYPSVCAYYRRPADPPGQLTGPSILQPGSNTYPGGCLNQTPPGWGLYNTPVVDPNDRSKIWTFSEYGEFATPCAWATRIIQFQVGTAGPPAVTVQDVVNGASFLPGISSGTWATVRGQNLAATTRTWQSSDFIGNALPTSLDGVSVTVAGQRAYLSYISPTQINFLVPDGLSPGSVNVQVFNGGTASNTVIASQSAVSPGLFVFSSRYPAAVHVDGTYVGPTGLLPGAAFGAARPGETIMLFGTGFGPSQPAVPSGQLVGVASPLALPVNVLIGGKPATVAFAGLTASGLDQINVTIPIDAASGEQSIVMSVNGSPTQSGMFLTIQ